MRVAIIYFPVKNKKQLQNITKGLVKGLEAQGHHVDLINGMTDVGKKLTIYKYIALGTEVTSFFKGNIPARVSEFLSQAGALIGKMSFAYLSKAKFGGEKTLLRLMKAMEKEGMIIRSSDVIMDPDSAEVIGKRLKIEA